MSGPGLGLLECGLAGVGVLVAVVLLGVRWEAVPRGWRSVSFVAVPMAVVLVAAALIIAQVPFQVRWAASRPAFERRAAELAEQPGASGAWVQVDTPSRIGLYEIQTAYRVPGGLLFYEAMGDGFDDAGFAYLPHGPTAAIEDAAEGGFEAPDYRHLSGPWYAWTASW